MSRAQSIAKRDRERRQAERKQRKADERRALSWMEKAAMRELDLGLAATPRGLNAVNRG